VHGKRCPRLPMNLDPKSLCNGDESAWNLWRRVKVKTLSFGLPAVDKRFLAPHGETLGLFPGQVVVSPILCLFVC